MTGKEDYRGERSRRDSLFLLTVLHDCNGAEICQAKVRNLSNSGMLVETGVSLSVGEKLRFDLRGIGPVTGEVVREEPDLFRFGIRFDRPVDAALARRPVSGTTVVPLPGQKFKV